ncbi:hypothetical protein [Salinibacterium sp. TMP30]|uniref:hypothetical protein n=1 Tax=Salinibacterium sp. TMP30 TaxID=3138237 RepID=UPI0031388211
MQSTTTAAGCFGDGRVGRSSDDEARVALFLECSGIRQAFTAELMFGPSGNREGGAWVPRAPAPGDEGDTEM